MCCRPFSILAFVAAALAVLPIAAQQTTGRLEIVAAVVEADLTVKPIPKFALSVFSSISPDAAAVATVVTSFDGKAELTLPAGSYRVVSDAPLVWNEQELSWDVAIEVVASATARVELSTDNARRNAAAGRMTDEARIYKSARKAVFVVEANVGHGSGFLVTSSGLIVTNDHVVRKSKYIAVQVDALRKVAAVPLVSDSEHDIAILRVNPNAVTGIEPLPLASSSTSGDVVAEGDRVLAIGNPMAKKSVLTMGIVSKVEAEAIISDVNINPGNSGGPLLNLRGEVVGINTFGLGGGSGPGVSGIVRIHLAGKALEEARSKEPTLEPPSNEPLPVVSHVQYPLAGLKQKSVVDPNLKAYHVEAGQIDLDFLTPPLLYSINRHAELKAADVRKKRNKGQPDAATEAGEGTYSWEQQSGEYAPVVTVRALPEKQLTKGSKTGRVFGALFGVITAGKYKFKTDFREMKLMRGGLEIRPIFPGRACEAVVANVALGAIQDIGCYGLYQYPPEAFDSGEPFELWVYDEEKPQTPVKVPLDAALVIRIRDDFEPFRQEVRKASEGGPPSPSP